MTYDEAVATTKSGLSKNIRRTEWQSIPTARGWVHVKPDGTMWWSENKYEKPYDPTDEDKVATDWEVKP